MMDLVSRLVLAVVVLLACSGLVYQGLRGVLGIH